MKKTNAVIIAIALGLTVTLFAADRQATTSAASPPRSPETFQAEVLKVFSATDGDAVFRAYLVKWKDQEVIVRDGILMSHYGVGDSMPVLAMNLPSPRGHDSPGLLHFAIGFQPGQIAAEKQTTTPPDSASGSHESLQAEVLKVFSATDNNAVFRAYLVKWKGQEVVVSDPLAGSAYGVGDSIRMLAMNHSRPGGQDKPRLLAFSATPQLRPFAADKRTTNQPTSTPGSFKTFQAEVLKVFSATNSNTVFRAYLIRWEGQKVIVSDPLARRAYAVGDTIPVIASNHPDPKGTDKPGRVSFTVGFSPRE
jgi:hypothetical protein